MLRSPWKGVHCGHVGVWLSAGVVVVAALVSAVFVTAAGSASQQPSGVIAFSSGRGVFVMQSDGTGVQSLWRGARTVLDVAWSPDGRRLAVSTSATANDAKSGGIWVMNADGSGALRVSNVAAPSVTWSPDGRRIAFTWKRYGNSISGDIWVMKPDGSNVRVLKRTPRMWERNVDWARTGSIAFDTGGYVPMIFVMKADGSGLRRVTPTPTRSRWNDSIEPDWSPDGRRIAFTYCSGTCQIAVMNANGLAFKRLTKGWGVVGRLVHHGAANWSPDGRQIAFVRGEASSSGATGAIYVMNADGTNVTALTTGVKAANPAWQPYTAP